MQIFPVLPPIGIADDNLLEVDDADAADDDYAKFTANGLEGRDYSEVRTDLGLVIGTNVQAHGDVLDDLNTLGVNTAQNQFLVGKTIGPPVLAWEFGATARTTIGLGTAATPTFSGINLTSLGNNGVLYKSSAGSTINTDSANFNYNDTTKTLDVNNITIDDAGNIGSVSDTDAIAIASDGKTTFTQDLTVNEDIIIGDAKYIGSASDPDAIQIEADGDVVFSQDVAVRGAEGLIVGTGATASNSIFTVRDPDNAQMYAVGDTAGFQFWLDDTPTRAARLLLGATGDLTVDVFNGTSWVSSFACKNSNGYFGIGTQDAVAQCQIQSVLNSLTGTDIDVSNLHLFLRNPANDTGEAVGIGFGLSTSDSAGIGAAIAHERVGSASYGKLHFATKPSGGGADIPIRVTIDSAGNTGFGTVTPTILIDANAKSGHTSIGGFAIKLTNKTGGNTVAGQLVRASAGTTDAFSTAAAGDENVIGITLDAGVADGSEAWVIVAGIADVLINGGGSTIGDRMISSATAGSADVWNVGGAIATHFQEIGHCIETRVGAGLARCVLHFN